MYSVCSVTSYDIRKKQPAKFRLTVISRNILEICLEIDDECFACPHASGAVWDGIKASINEKIILLKLRTTLFRKY